MLSKFPVPGRPTNLDSSRTRAYAEGAGGGCLDFFYPLAFLIFLRCTRRRSDID